MKRVCFAVLVVVVLTGACLAQSPRQVEVVAEVSLTNLTQDNGGSLFTPAQTGMFRVTMYVQSTGGNPQNAQGIYPQFHWTDDDGLESQSLPPVNDGGPQAPFSTVFVIKALANTAIIWGTEMAPLDNSVYEVYIALERIGPKVQ
jgi:hypothetical protein